MFRVHGLLLGSSEASCVKVLGFLVVVFGVLVDGVEVEGFRLVLESSPGDSLRLRAGRF